METFKLVEYVYVDEGFDWYGVSVIEDTGWIEWPEDKVKALSRLISQGKVKGRKSFSRIALVFRRPPYEEPELESFVSDIVKQEEEKKRKKAERAKKAAKTREENRLKKKKKMLEELKKELGEN